MALAHNPTLIAGKQLSIQDVHIRVAWHGAVYILYMSMANTL